MVNTDSSIEEEIKERIAAGNRACHVHKKLFISKLLSRSVKLQLYNTLIRPIVTYASETWVLKENLINKLMSFERKIMRKIQDDSGGICNTLGNDSMCDSKQKSSYEQKKIRTILRARTAIT
jgi:hypothetical protein